MASFTEGEGFSRLIRNLRIPCGKTKKTVRSLNSGHLEIESSRDREGTFAPKIIPKRQLIVTSELEDKVLAMYAKGMSTRDISGFILEMYAMEISATEISHIADCVIPALNEWRTRPLEAVYPFVFLDCIHYKVRENGTVKSRAVYNILGINKEGKKELLGVYVSENEGAKFCGAARAAVRVDRPEAAWRSGHAHCLHRHSAHNLHDQRHRGDAWHGPPRGK